MRGLDAATRANGACPRPATGSKHIRLSAQPGRAAPRFGVARPKRLKRMSGRGRTVTVPPRCRCSMAAAAQPIRVSAQLCCRRRRRFFNDAAGQVSRLTTAQAFVVTDAPRVLQLRVTDGSPRRRGVLNAQRLLDILPDPGLVSDPYLRWTAPRSCARARLRGDGACVEPGALGAAAPHSDA